MLSSAIIASYTKGWSNVPWNPGLASMLTFKSKYEKRDGTITQINCWVRLDDRMLVPVESVPISTNDLRTEYHPQVWEPKMPPKPGQVQLIAQSYDLLRQGKNHVFEAPTGFGKTYCGSAIACRLGQPTIIVVTKQDLMDSWHKTLVNLMGIPLSDIGILQAQKNKWKGCRFVLAMVHSLSMYEKYDDEVYEYFGTAIFDEVHRMGAPYFNPVCGRLTAKYKLGLSATPKRSDEMTPVFRWHLGPTLVKATVVPMIPRVIQKQTGWKLPRVAQMNDQTGDKEMVPMQASPGAMGHVTKMMGSSKERNAIIARFVKQAYDAGRNIVVMSDLISGHLHKLFIAFGAVGIPGEDMGYYTGEQSKAELEASKKKRVVLATYGMCGEGTDVPHWDTLVLATPRKEVKQPLGRILRLVEGKPTPVCFDPIDYDPVFKGLAKARELTYLQLGATLVKK